jgi:hypothetical protein
MLRQRKTAAAQGRQIDRRGGQRRFTDQPRLENEMENCEEHDEAGDGVEPARKPATRERHERENSVRREWAPLTTQ